MLPKTLRLTALLAAVCLLPAGPGTGGDVDEVTGNRRGRRHGHE